MKNFDIPVQYRSPIISKIKELRKINDRTKKDFTPTVLDFGKIKFSIARHFGFCYGVENAIEIVYNTIQNNLDKRIFLLSEMIHNPLVNDDLLQQGVRFIMDTHGKQLIPWSEINNDDIVVIPAFGTTVEIETLLNKKGIAIEKYNTTCPFVEKVWKKSVKLSEDDCTIVIHGKYDHEETRATFSHSSTTGKAIIVQNITETKTLAAYIKGEINDDDFEALFHNRYSKGFDPKKDLQKIGVVNQTTMLATDTQEIADYLLQTMIFKYGKEQSSEHFADTRDTLCYATSDNQNAVYGMLNNHEADLAIVVGGYNSSNTSHLVELCEKEITSYHISSAEKIISKDEISHYKFRTKEELLTPHFLPQKENTHVLITSGASCPDATVDEIIQKIAAYYLNENELLNSIANISETYTA